MSRIIAVSLFVVLLFATMLGLSLSLAPGLSVKNAYLYIIIVFIFFRAIVEGKPGGLLEEPIPFAGLHFCFLALICWAIASWFFMTFLATHINYNAIRGLVALKGAIVDYYLLFLAFFFLIREKSEVLRASSTIIAAIVLYNAITFVDVYTPLEFGLATEQEDQKVWGPMGHSNQFGAFLAFFLPAMIVLAISSQRVKRVFFAAGAIMTFILLVATLARAAYLGALIGLAVAAFFYRSYVPLNTYLRNAALAVMIGGLLLLVSGQWDDLYERTVETTARAANIDDLGSGRLSIWSNAMSKVAESPIALITGVGWDSYAQSRWFQLAAHNTYLETYFELGIVGVIFYLLTLVVSLGYITRAFPLASVFERQMLFSVSIGLCMLIVFLFFGQLSEALIFMWAYLGLMLKLAHTLGVSQ